MNKALSFDDVLITPSFSFIESRKDVDTSQLFCGLNLKLPIISSNMDTVTEYRMAKAMGDYGAIGALHRFCSIEDNMKMFTNSSPHHPIVSIGIGNKELERAEALYSVGANIFLVDVAHGASDIVVKQVKQLRNLLHHSAKIIVGNFATAEGIKEFNYYYGGQVDAYKVGIGGGSACLTRVVTGCGLPTFASIMDCAQLGVDIIADGGIRNSGDVAKALAAGAKAVMLGGMLAGTSESPGEVYSSINELANYSYLPSQPEIKHYSSDIPYGKVFKKYRGSASQESYQVQGKVAQHRTAEGDSFLVDYVGNVENVLQNIEAGLRSSMTYVGANYLSEFREFAQFVEITNNGLKESKAHGKN